MFEFICVVALVFCYSGAGIIVSAMNGFDITEGLNKPSESDTDDDDEPWCLS